MKAGSAENYERIEIRLSKVTTPRAWENKVQCLMLSGMSREEAEKHACDPIELELFYEVGSGLFAVESEATECFGCVKSPYTGEDIEPCED